MEAGLPLRIEPDRVAEQQGVLEGLIPLERMPRLVASCAEAGGDASLRLEFSRISEGQIQVKGRISAEVRVICQRCLEPMSLVLEARPNLLLVQRRDEIGSRAEDEDVETIIFDTHLSLPELVEDELLLAMPMIPMHPADICNIKTSAKGDAETGREDNPFAVLARLKSGTPED